MRKAASFLIVTLSCIVATPQIYADASGPDDDAYETSVLEASVVEPEPQPEPEPAPEIKETKPEPKPEPKPAPKVPFTAFTGKVLKNKVRLRTQPSLESGVVRELANGEMLAVIGETEDFYAVEPPADIKAYIYRTYVLDGVVEGNHVNVRLAPELNAPVIAQMNSGDPVKGAVSTTDKRWLEISPPVNAHFYVAKEYLNKAGDIHLISNLKKRQVEVAALISNARLTSQVELQKPFDQIHLDAAIQKLNKVISQYGEFPVEIAQAKELLQSIQNSYLRKQVSHVESVAKTSPQKRDSVATTSHGEISKTQAIVTTAMSAWMPVEQNLYQTWAAQNNNGSIEEFYRHQQSNTLHGILEPYNRVVKNRPGDYVLVSETHHQPIAYLYSTQINLQDRLGQTVEVDVTPRDNNHFAYPAYFVLSVR